ncbi:Carbohydrate binding domain protein [compost metagenome]
MPYSRIRTDFRDMSNRPFNGTMLAILNAPVELPEGTVILNQRFEYPVKNGVAYDDATYTIFAELPATDTAQPADTPISIFLKDASGRLFYHGSFVIPEMIDNQPIALADLTSQDPSAPSALSVKMIAGLSGDIALEGQVSVDQSTNTIVFHGLRFKGPWNADDTFFEGDVVSYSDDLWVANRENQGVTPEAGPDWSLFLEQPPMITPEPTGIRWRGTWQTGVIYELLDAVEYQGSSYVCLLTHQSAANNAPSDSSSRWDLFAQRSLGINWKGPWNAAATYKRSDAVSYQGSSYIAVADVPANNPPGSTQAPLPAGNVASPTAGSVVGTTSAAGHGSAQAFDGDPATYWEAATGSGYFNTVGLANVWGGVLREITSVVIRQHDTDYHNKIGSIFVQYTQDAGATWQDAAAGALLIPNSGFGEQTVNLPTPVMANGMRVKANAGTTAGGGSYPWRIYGLKFMANALAGADYWDLIAQKGQDGTGASLSSLSDVDPTGLADGKVLKYDAASSKWKPADDATSASGGPTTLDGLTDVDLTMAPTDGQVLKFDEASGKWKAGADNAGTGGGGSGVQLRVAATRTTNLAVPGNGTSQTIIVWDNETTDAANEYNPATGRFMAASAGEYMFVAHVEMKRDSAGSNNTGVGLVRNGGAARWVGKYVQSGDLAWQNAGPFMFHVTLAAGDTVDIVARVANASTIQADGTVQSGISTSYCSLKVYKLS